MTLLAAAAGDPTTVLLNYGAVGAMLVLLGLFSWAAYKRERDRADRLERLLQETNERIAERFVEALKGARDALIEANDYLRDLSHRRRP